MIFMVTHYFQLSDYKQGYKDVKTTLSVRNRHHREKVIMKYNLESFPNVSTLSRNIKYDDWNVRSVDYYTYT